MKRRVCTGVWGAAVALLVAGSGAQAAGKTATFDVAVVNTRPGVQLTVNSKVWVTESQARADVDNPGSTGKLRLIVSNGYFYQIDPQAKKYSREPIPAEWKKRKDNFDLLLGKFAYDASDAIKHTKKVRTETFQGYPCDVQEGSETKGPATALTLWVPQKLEPKIPLKVVRTMKVTQGGATQEQTTTAIINNLKLNQPVAPATFEIPKGYKLVQPPARKGRPGAGRK